MHPSIPSSLVYRSRSPPYVSSLQKNAHKDGRNENSAERAVLLSNAFSLSAHLPFASFQLQLPFHSAIQLRYCSTHPSHPSISTHKERRRQTDTRHAKRARPSQTKEIEKKEHKRIILGSLFIHWLPLPAGCSGAPTSLSITALPCSARSASKTYFR